MSKIDRANLGFCFDEYEGNANLTIGLTLTESPGRDCFSLPLSMIARGANGSMVFLETRETPMIPWGIFTRFPLDQPL